jgi:hypothetical protein
MISDNIHHDGAFWGIRFPVLAFPFDQSAIDIIKEDLEDRRDPVLKAALQGFDLAVIMFAVVVEADRESVKHRINFLVRNLKENSCQYLVKKKPAVRRQVSVTVMIWD